MPPDARSPHPLVSVVLVSWNTRDLLAAAVASVPPAAAGAPTEIVVVDNASTDGSPEWVADHHPEVTLIRNTANEGFGRANNRGFAASTAPYILLLNSDAALRPGALEVLVESLAAHPEAGAVGARLVFPDGRFQASYADFPTLRSEALALAGLAARIHGPRYPSREEADSREAREVDWVGGACVLLRRTALDAAGGFDPDYHMYSEELDLCRRVWRAGWTVRYCPAAVAAHHGGQSTRQRPADQPLWLWTSRVRYFRKHHARWEAAALGWMIRAAYVGRGLWWTARSLASRGSAREIWRRRASSAWRVTGGARA